LTVSSALTIVRFAEIVRLRLEGRYVRIVAAGSVDRMGGNPMKSLKTLALGAALLASASVVSFAALAKDLTVGVSWSNFQEERWKTDEAAIKGALEAAGAKYISADAQASPQKQLTDVESLISKGANVLIILAMDNEAILPAVKKATDEGIPVIAYDRLIESPNVLYITFDNVGVGRMMAKAIEAAKPAGNYAFIKGDKGDANANFLFSGITEVLKPAMDAGKIKDVGETYTDGWKPDNAQKEMEQILTKNNNKVDAAVVENDGMAGGAIAALAAQGLAGVVPVSGQDGDHAAINRVALGTQTVSVWKDARDLGKAAGEAAVALGNGKKRTDIAGVKPFSGGPKHMTVDGILLTPLPVTRDNLNVIVDKGWITKAEVCNGVKPGTVKFCG
jgi:D-xylose transport system substrate-binding protein